MLLSGYVMYLRTQLSTSSLQKRWVRRRKSLEKQLRNKNKKQSRLSRQTLGNLQPLLLIKLLTVELVLTEK
ncbi:hypothetical protein BMAGN_0787 [Bifidobacterium magnum]|uniref:Uncharacterized protein n=1 Tax=Bifidobacterium magnum TaxID=1692 RepID=A0A087B986_9BIFI|nr:hypothetical protein BMAGN_0787 [Bifidobacterium magnum]